MAKEQASIPGSWKYRRRFMIGVTIFICAFMVFTVLRLGDTPTTLNAITMGFSAITMIVGSYVFGAVWDHREARKANVGSSVDTEPSGMDQP